MNSTTFSGPMRRQICEFMRFRKSLGFSMRNTAYIYAEFDRFLAKQYPKTKLISRPMIVDYLATTKHLHSTSRGYRVTLLRGFCRYLYQKDSKNYVPEPRILPWGKRKLMPHVFTDGEVENILEAMNCQKYRAPIVGKTFVTMVALLAATGMRSGEVERLNLEDVDLESSVLTIHRSKFFKSRRVPISPSVVAALRCYREVRFKHRQPFEAKAPFFISEQGRRALVHTAGDRFRIAVRQLEIKSQSGGWARLHDLRHTFATRWMDDIYRSGNDPSARLPILATYLGHVNLDHTQTYLHPSIELLAMAGSKFQNFSTNHQ